jgi:hypothetical protein
VYSEVHLLRSYEGAPLYGELREWLEGKGFNVAREELVH